MKANHRLLVPLFIFSLQFYPKIVRSSNQDSHYVMHNCQKSSETYTVGSTFQAMLNDTLFSVLPAKALKTTFANSTNGTGIDQVNALFYCRADVDPLGCHDCVVAAADKVTNRCQFLKEAVIWFEECTLRYANRSIFFIDEETPLYIYTNNSGIVNDDLLNHLDDEFDSAMDELIKQAASFRNLQGFAITQLNVSSTTVLHCVVQCSPDISGAPCERCLISAVRQRDKWEETMIFMPSCFIRIDLYSTTRSTTQSMTPPLPSADDKTAIMIGVISTVIGMFAILAILIVVCCYIRYWPDSPGDRALKVLSYIQLAVATNGFIRLNYLGEADSVYRGVLQGQKVAVKRLKELNYDNQESWELQSIVDFISEIRNNFSVVHDNIVKVVGYCLQGNHKLLVYELIENNSLKKHLHGTYTEPGNLTWENRKRIALGCAKGLRYLHERDQRIIHRDIKPSNILLDFNYEPKLADFGLAGVFPDNAYYVSSIVKGTHGYLDPEYFEANVLTEKSDVYSFGVVLLELITGKKPNPFVHVPVNILWSILQKLPEFAFDGPNDSTCHGQMDSTSEIEIQALTFEDPKGRTSEGLEGCNLQSYVDPRLNAEADVEEMARMIICAALCVHPYRDLRLCMNQVVQLLESGSLLADDVAYMIANVRPRSEPESSSSNAYPDRLGLAELRRLATQVLTHMTN